jgi:hypothetical protein
MRREEGEFSLYFQGNIAMHSEDRREHGSLERDSHEQRNLTSFPSGNQSHNPITGWEHIRKFR